MPLFYTATILRLHSLNDIENGQHLAFMRLVYNIIGVVVAVFVVLYPFPHLTRPLRKADVARPEKRQPDEPSLASTRAL
jgi:uncharacterized membrane protein YgaE (UPF0421/DUF939 family)